MEQPRLLDRVRNAIRARHYSRRTEETYVHWIKRYIFFHNKTHPAAMGAEHVNAFLTHLAVAQNVAASTQSQALSALVFLYRHVLDDPLPWIDEIVRATRPKRIPVVLTREEVRAWRWNGVAVCHPEPRAVCGAKDLKMRFSRLKSKTWTSGRA